MFKRAIIFIAFAVFVVSCARDPNKLKNNYLNSGNNYLRSRKFREAEIQFRNAIQVDPKFAAAHSQLGRVYLALGNSEAAYREFRTTLNLTPQDPQAQLNLAELQIGRREYAEAKSALQQVLKANPDNARAHAVMAQEDLATQNVPGAIAEFERVIALDPRGVGGYTALGAAYMAEGQSAEAETIYKKAVETNPRSIDARIALAELYFSQRSWSQAEAEARAACNLGLPAALPHLILGRTLVAEGRLADAEKAYAALKSVAPDDPRAYQALASFYSSTGQKAKALIEFEDLAASKPKDIVVKARLIETLIDLNRIGEAAPLVRAAVDKAGSDPRILLSYGRVLIAEGKYREAMAALQKAVASEATSAAAYYYLGVAQMRAGETALARNSFARALELAPDMGPASAALASLNVKDGNSEDALKQAHAATHSNPGLAQGYVASARAQIATGDAANGRASLEDALRRDPLNLAALAELLNLSIRQGKTAEMVERMDVLLRQNPRNPGLRFLLALGEFNLKDLDKAEANLKQAIALDPKTPHAWTLMANIDFARGRLERAKADLRNAIAASPRTVSNYTALGTQYERENNWQEAKKLFERAHDIDPNSGFVAAELAFLYLEHGGDVNVALALAQSARQAMPNSPVTADALGWAYYKLGSADLAVKQLEQSVQMIPTNPVYQYHLGTAYFSARRWDKAARSLRSALSEDSNFPYATAAKAELDRIGQQGR